jgi:hypothetical protein
MSEKKEHDDGNPEIDIQRRNVISGSLTLLGTASTGLLTGCGGGGGDAAGGGGGGVEAVPPRHPSNWCHRNPRTARQE